MRTLTATCALAALLCLQAQVLRAQDGLDEATGGFGSVAFDLDSQRHDVAKACAVQSDGMLVLVGSVTDDDGELNKIAIARVGLDGHPDPSFGNTSDGRVVIDLTALGFGLKDGRASAVIVDDQGRLLVAGTVKLTAGGANRVFVLRLLADGAIDNSFLFNGISGGWYFSTYMQGVSVAALDLAGNLWIVGPELEDTTGDWSFLRLSPNGAELTAQRIPIGASYSWSGPTALLFQPDGKTLVGGWGQLDAPTFHTSFLVHRLLAGGPTYTSDPTFGFSSDGWAYLEYPQSAWLRSLALLPNLGLVVAGELGSIGAEDVLVQRLNRDGNSDGTFEEIVSFDLGGSGGDGTFGEVRMVAQSDGKIVLAARAQTEDTANWANVGVARLLASGGLDPSFGGLGTGKRVFSMATPPPGAGDERLFCLVLAGGKAVVGGSREYIAPDYDFVFRRLQSNLIFTDGFESGTTFFW